MISVILPTYNESGNILSLIDSVHLHLRKIEHEIIVVDDQSSDGTPFKVKEKNDPAVRLVERCAPGGLRSLAGSIGEGVSLTSGDVLVIMDSDFNHDPADIPRMLAALEGVDCVTASRFISGGGMRPMWRWWASRVFNIFIQMMLRTRMTDHLFGFFVFRRDVLMSLRAEKIFYGFGDYAIRFLFCLQQDKRRIREVPAFCYPRRSGQGNGRLLQTFLGYFWAVISLARSRS